MRLPIVVAVSIGSLIGYEMFLAFTATGRIANASNAMNQGFMQVVVRSIVSDAQQNAGRGPDHVIQLLHAGQFPSGKVRAAHSATTDSDVRAADFSMTEFALMNTDEQETAVDLAVHEFAAGHDRLSDG